MIKIGFLYKIQNLTLFLGFSYFTFQGEVIEVGNHRELVEKGGRYAELWEHQQQEERGEIENEKL